MTDLKTPPKITADWQMPIYIAKFGHFYNSCNTMVANCS